MKGTTLILVPSTIEIELLLPKTAQHLGGTHFHVWQDGEVIWAICGIGAAATAMTTTHLYNRFNPARMVLAGIAGAFRNSGLQIGQVVQVREDSFADLGYEARGDLITLDAMKLPVLHTPEKDLGCRYPLALLDSQTPDVAAITVNRITASEARAEALWKGFGADIEQMEGAGAALVCANFNLPFFHLRAISNWVGPRNPSEWRVDQACSALVEKLASLL